MDVDINQVVMGMDHVIVGMYQVVMGTSHVAQVLINYLPCIELIVMGSGQAWSHIYDQGLEKTLCGNVNGFVAT